MTGFEVIGFTWNQFSGSPGKFVQVVFQAIEVIGQKEDEVHVYDSLNSYAHGYLRETSKAICQKTYCFFATLRVINMPVQHQHNNVDCEVFAIAFATDCVFKLKSETKLHPTKRM